QVFAFEADTGKILDIVINSLYSQKEIFLRELISNASDAINKRKFSVLGAGDSSETFDGEITIATDKKSKTLTVSDNGIGLSADEMRETLGTIASSGTKAFVESLGEAKEGEELTDQLIGQFGVGFYSAFMVAERIEVVSRRHGQEKATQWSSDGQSGYAIAGSERDTVGTSVTLHLRKEAKEFIEKERIAFLVRKYSDHVAQPIMWVDGKDDPDRLNSAAALWTRPARDITEDEYRNFYQSLASAYDAPFATLHNRTEGAVEFTNLLFIPSMAPFDLYDPERRSRLNLYVNRVFITDNCEGLIPKWLRFLRGVIDTPDVDLNVSREMLQQNPVVTKINKAVVKRVLGEFGKALDKRREDYENAWSALGRVIKEGLYEDDANRTKILDISLFRSTRTEGMITLKEYVDGFAKSQETIYYLSAENADLALTSPHLESFRAKGIDVLLLTDPIDDFWLANTPEYDGRTFQSITRGEVDISNVGESKSDDETAETVLSDSFVAKMKHVLGGDVADVRSSSNLETSLARLVANESGMDPQMERMMRMHNPDFQGGPKVLEVNAKHPLVKALNSKVEAGDFAASDSFARLLYDSAVVAEGEPIADPRDFTNRITAVMEAALGATK
ncbi:MAG: molecular chaperone HtpG, partial [Pseudomonadota bacterium]|nr:molecular chaperone HtpG [Pseudomonadota bacterium]